MNYATAATVLSVFLVLLGIITADYLMIGIGGLLLMMAGLMKDIQRNYVGLVLLTKALDASSEVDEEHDQKIVTLVNQVGDLLRQHNPTVEEIEALQAEVAELKRELSHTKDQLGKQGIIN